MIPRLTHCRLNRALVLALTALAGLGVSAQAAEHPGRRVAPHRHPRQHRLMVGYFPQWGLYNDEPYVAKSLVTSGSAARLDQINYAQGSVQGGRCSVADANADLENTFTAEESIDGKADDPASPFQGYFHQLKELKAKYPKLKILISLEGKASDFAEDAKPEKRRAFVASCIQTFIRGRFAAGVVEPGIFDGFDVDWESPEREDAGNFRALLEEFRRQMTAVRRGLMLSVAVGQAPGMLPGTDFAAIGRLVDEVGIMNYDYNGPWSATTGFVAPLFTDPDGPGADYSIEHSIVSYKAAGVPEKKLLMGLPFYGYSWTDVSDENNGLAQAGKGDHADQPYHYIRGLDSSFATYRDKRARAPWRFDGETFWTFEDPVSVRYKVSYASTQHLGGVMIWELSGDTEDAELLNTVYRSLRHPLKRRVFGAAGE
jgi:chitinase